ncbi:hypothetical protein [uncultured Desulfobacter sp.]|uniref:hypothetical protein n=1 Tax=uncultured Desulfobacter sp. TaxID=240139 RepID=UPI0029F4C7B3|nr:hypothetical protein [uncultured Desulfobacter sp.]
MTDGLVTFWSAVTGGLIAGGASIWTAKIILKEQRFEDAGKNFRSIIMSIGMDDFAPTNTDEEWNHQFENLIRDYYRVKNAAIEFSYYLPDKDGAILRKKAFDLANIFPGHKNLAILSGEFKKEAFSLMEFTKKKSKARYAQKAVGFITSLKNRIR